MTDKNPKGEKTIVEDRYLGSVLGNRLDAFNNASYNLRLYMIPDRTADGGGYLNGARKLPNILQAKKNIFCRTTFESYQYFVSEIEPILFLSNREL